MGDDDLFAGLQRLRGIDEPGRHKSSDRRRWRHLLWGGGLMALSMVLLIAGASYDRSRTEPRPSEGRGGVGTDVIDEPASGEDIATASPPTSPSTTLPPFDGWVDPASSGSPWSTTVQGLLTFRGNPTRSYYGEGPVPDHPEILWSFPESGGMCGESSGEMWCGTGWTGQPSVWDADDGSTWVAFGAYDKAVHWLDGSTGDRLLDDFPVGDIIKGSVTVDPDGFPLLYTGSRDSYFRVIAMDRGQQPVELYSLSAEAVSPTLWNNDWDSSAMVIDDYLFVGGENSQFHILKLNRAYDASGLVTVAPELVFNAPSWDDQLLTDLGDDEVSVENSVAISGNTVYFANSGGLIQGWDITTLAEGGTPQRTFRFWTGEDVDASLVVDAEGFLYAGVEYEKGRARAEEVGQLIKLDPTKPEDPLVWSVDDGFIIKSGIWATPAIWGDMVYAAFNSGRVIGVDRHTGEIVWEKFLGSQTWQSPVVVDDILLQGDCEGVLHAYDVSDPTIDPPELWTVQLPGCIESTPAVWGGRIYVGTRSGQFHAIGTPSAEVVPDESTQPPE